MDDKIILRRMKESDAKDVAAICKKIFGKHGAPRRNHFADVARSWRHKYFVAELDGKIVACMGARIADFYEDYYEAKRDEAKIEIVAVDPDYQGQGIGTKLFAKLIAELDEKGVKVNSLLVHSSNTPAIKFYERFDFKGFDCPKRYPDAEPDMMIMIRFNNMEESEES